MRKTTRTADAPVAIQPDAVYFVRDLVQLLGFTGSSLRTARRRTGLRVGRRLGRSYCLGAWLLEWFAAGELAGVAPNGTHGVDSRPAREG